MSGDWNNRMGPGVGIAGMIVGLLTAMNCGCGDGCSQVAIDQSPSELPRRDDPGMAMLWSQAAKDRLAICPIINPADIHHVDALGKGFPDTTVVVDHFARIAVSGKIEQEPLDNLCRLAKYPNTYVKTSAFYALGKKTPPYTDLVPMIRKVVDAFGPERLMWVSDCPYQVQGIHDYESSIALIRNKIDFLSDGDERWMLRKTAEKVFFA